MRLLLRSLTYILFIYTCFILAPISSFADTVDTRTGPLVVFGIVVDTAFMLALITGTIIPLVSSLLSKTHWSSGVTGVITMALAAISGFFTEWAQSSNASHYDWKHAVLIAIGTLLMAFLGRNVAWKGSKTDAKLLAIGSGKVA